MYYHTHYTASDCLDAITVHTKVEDVREEEDVHDCFVSDAGVSI